MDRLDELAAHGEHQHRCEFPAGEGKHRGLTGDRKGDKRRTLAPKTQQVARDTLRAFKDPGEFGDPRAEIDIAPGIRGEYLEQAAEVAV